MGKIHIFNDDVNCESSSFIKRFLADHGINYGNFQLNNVATRYSKLITITEQQREELIYSYPELTEKFEKKKDYKHDVVCLYPELPVLDMILSKFAPIHYHFETEYWYVFDGEAEFGFLGQNGVKFLITVQAGEYIQVPEGYWQWFDLTNEKRMKAMRFFYKTESVPVLEK
ncbi:cupin domain-containing protein [Bacillus bombysepticus]